MGTSRYGFGTLVELEIEILAKKGATSEPSRRVKKEVDQAIRGSAIKRLALCGENRIYL